MEPSRYLPERVHSQFVSPAFQLMLATSWAAPAACEDLQDAEIRAALAAKPDWSEYCFLIDRHRTHGFAWTALKRAGGLDLPLPVRQWLTRQSDLCRTQGLEGTRALLSLLRAFQGLSIEVMPLKGPFLSYSLYGDVGIRNSEDLDIEVREDDVDRAQVYLESAGFELLDCRFSMTQRQRKLIRERNHHLRFTHKDQGLIVELHWRCSWETPEMKIARWGRGVPATWFGCEHLAMAPIDLTGYLIRHGSQHQWSRAKWLGDIARIYTISSASWKELLGSSIDFSIRDPTRLALLLLKACYRLRVSEDFDPNDLRVPMFLFEESVRSMTTRSEHEDQPALTRLLSTARSIRFRRRILPGSSWRVLLKELMFLPQDFQAVVLPDSLFWLYPVMRPFIWLWRSIKTAQNAVR